MSVKDYEIELLNCPDKKSENIFQKISYTYEFDLLEYRDIPDDYFDFFLRLLSEEKFFRKPGVWNFVLVFGTEGHKLTVDHYDKIANTIVNNFAHYSDENLCLAVCEFIAYNYEHKRAEKLLLKLKKIEKKKIEKGFADEGLYLLSNEIRRSQSNIKNID